MTGKFKPGDIVVLNFEGRASYFSGLSKYVFRVQVDVPNRFWKDGLCKVQDVNGEQSWIRIQEEYLEFHVTHLLEKV